MVERLRLDLLGTEPLHDADARDRLLDHAGEVAQLLLQREVHRLDLVREAVRRELEQRHEREHHQREAGRVVEEDPDHDDHRERARRRQREQDHHGLDLLDVGVGPGHQLAGLRFVVESEVQALEMGEEPLAQVRLGAQRDPEGRVPPESGADRLDHADGEHDEHEAHRRAGVALHHPLVDRGGREQRDRDLRGSPEEPRGHAAEHPRALGSDRLVHEAPPGPSGRPLAVHVPPPGCLHWRRARRTRSGRAGQGTSAFGVSFWGFPGLPPRAP